MQNVYICILSSVRHHAISSTIMQWLIPAAKCCEHIAMQGLAVETVCINKMHCLFLQSSSCLRSHDFIIIGDTLEFIGVLVRRMVVGDLGMIKFMLEMVCFVEAVVHFVEAGGWMVLEGG